MYQRKSRLSPRKQGRLTEHFVAGTTARAAAEIIGVQPNRKPMGHFGHSILIAKVRQKCLI
jgi:transposase-like protein